MTDLSYEILCTSCREPIPSTAEICPACGHSLRRRDVPSFAVEQPAAPAADVFAASAPAVVFTPGLQADGGRAYGGFRIRVAASFVDDVLVGVPLWLLVHTFGSYGLLGLLGTILYYPLMESSRTQATVGKIVFSMIVTDTSFRRISFGRALGRYLAKGLSGLLLYLGYVMVAFTPQKRGLHDYIAGTVVLRV
jgi:uncharacterized RDD family membrane protein YckC